jgi:hypothetical protein
LDYIFNTLSKRQVETISDIITESLSNGKINLEDELNECDMDQYKRLYGNQKEVSH